MAALQHCAFPVWTQPCGVNLFPINLTMQKLSWPGNGFQKGPLADWRQRLVQGFEGLQSQIFLWQEVVQTALRDGLEGVVHGPQKHLQELS